MAEDETESLLTGAEVKRRRRELIAVGVASATLIAFVLAQTTLPPLAGLTADRALMLTGLAPGQTLLVTGAAGFIGFHTAKLLLQQPNLLFASARHLFGVPADYEQFHRSILANPDAVRSVMLQRSTQRSASGFSRRPAEQREAIVEAELANARLSRAPPQR